MKKLLLFGFICSLITVFSCNKGNEDYSNLRGEILKEWRIPLRAVNVNPIPTNRTDTGELILQLTDKNNLTYQYNITDLQNGDFITGAGLYTGDPLTNGQLLLDFAPRLAPTYGSRSLYDIRQSLVDSLLNPSTDLYVLITSTQFPNGLLRTQLHNEVVFSTDVRLTGANEVPPVNTTATGLASLRLTKNRILYSKVTVTNVEPNDNLTAAHIHTGATGVNGPVLIGLASSAADFGVTKTTNLTEALYNSVLNDRLYVNVHSTLHPAGIIRGQIR